MLSIKRFEKVTMNHSIVYQIINKIEQTVKFLIKNYRRIYKMILGGLLL